MPDPSAERACENSDAPSPPLSTVAPRKAFIAHRLIVFVREFAQCVAPSDLTAAMLLGLLAAATEGVGLALLVPLVGAVGDPSGTMGRLGEAVQQGLGAIGLPVSLPTLLAIFVGLIVLRT